MTAARRELFKLAEEVQKPNTFYSLTLGGQPQVVMMSQEEFDSMMETIEILSDPETLKRIEESEKEIEQGKYVTLDQLEKELYIGRSRSKKSKR